MDSPVNEPVVIAKIEIRPQTSKRNEPWWSIWTEAGNRAIYQSDPNLVTAFEKAVDSVRELTGENGELFFHAIEEPSHLGLLAEVDA